MGVFTDEKFLREGGGHYQNLDNNFAQITLKVIFNYISKGKLEFKRFKRKEFYKLFKGKGKMEPAAIIGESREGNLKLLEGEVCGFYKRQQDKLVQHLNQHNSELVFLIKFSDILVAQILCKVTPSERKAFPSIYIV